MTDIPLQCSTLGKHWDPLVIGITNPAFADAENAESLRRAIIVEFPTILMPSIREAVRNYDHRPPSNWAVEEFRNVLLDIRNSAPEQSVILQDFFDSLMAGATVCRGGHAAFEQALEYTVRRAIRRVRQSIHQSCVHEKETGRGVNRIKSTLHRFDEAVKIFEEDGTFVAELLNSRDRRKHVTTRNVKQSRLDQGPLL